MTIDEVITSIPSRARVGIALSSVEHVAIALADEPAALLEVHKGLEDGWHWVQGGEIDPIKFYDRVDPLALASADFPMGSAKKNVLLAAVAAFSYVTSEMLSYPSPGIDPEDRTLDSEMSDVGGDDLLDCLQRAAGGVANAAAEAQWQNHLAARVFADFRAEDADQLGPAMVRGYFLIDVTQMQSKSPVRARP